MKTIHEWPPRAGDAQASGGASTERAVRLPRAGLPGREACVIELSAAEPQVPTVVITAHEVTGPVLIAHTRNFADQSAPILLDPRPIRPGPDGTAAADARCGTCNGAKPFILCGEAETWIVLQHRQGCRHLAELAALVGVRP